MSKIVLCAFREIKSIVSLLWYSVDRFASISVVVVVVECRRVKVPWRRPMVVPEGRSLGCCVTHRNCGEDFLYCRRPRLPKSYSMSAQRL